jgi:thymidylate synthase
MKENNIEHQYLKLLKDILDNGVEKQDRTGTGTISVFGRQIRHDMKLGFPLLTTKKMYFKGIVTELLWFLRGDTNIKYLVDNDCHIWDGDCYKNYLNETQEEASYTKEEFIDLIKTDEVWANVWGDLGPIYGKQWRDWGSKKEYGQGESIMYGGQDQIQNLINDLKSNPDSRRLMVNSWNVGELGQMTLPPCHYSFQVYTRELSLDERKKIWNKNNFSQDMSWHNMEEHDIIDLLNEDNIPTRAISLMWNQRSVDTGLGLGFNIASYGLLLEIIAKEVGMIPYELIGNLGDCHIYNNHISGLKEQLTREPHMLPKICLDYREGEYNKDLTDLTPDDFVIFDYQSHLPIKLPLSN